MSDDLYRHEAKILFHCKNTNQDLNLWKREGHPLQIVQLFFYCIYWDLQSCFPIGSWFANQPWNWQYNPGWQPNPHLFYCGQSVNCQRFLLVDFFLAAQGNLVISLKTTAFIFHQEGVPFPIFDIFIWDPGNIVTYLQYVLKLVLNPRSWNWTICLVRLRHPDDEQYRPSSSLSARCVSLSLWSPSPYVTSPSLICLLINRHFCCQVLRPPLSSLKALIVLLSEEM